MFSIVAGVFMTLIVSASSVKTTSRCADSACTCTAGTCCDGPVCTCKK
jgi:hypothetical protein